MSDDDKPPTINGLVGELMRRLLGREVLMLLAFSLVLVGATLYGTNALAQAVDAHVDAGVAPTARRAEEVSARLEQHLVEDAQAKRQAAADLHEVQADIRALYRAVQTGRPQPRLEKPLPSLDGGP